MKRDLTFFVGVIGDDITLTDGEGHNFKVGDMITTGYDYREINNIAMVDDRNAFAGLFYTENQINDIINTANELRNDNKIAKFLNFCLRNNVNNFNEFCQAWFEDAVNVWQVAKLTEKNKAA